MRAHFIIAALLLSGCTGITEVRGRYADSVSPKDAGEIRRLIARPPHFGHTVTTLHAIGRDRVRVEVREYSDRACDGVILEVVRRGGTWHIDDHAPRRWITERTVVVS